jgi:hypothetical protein
MTMHSSDAANVLTAIDRLVMVIERENAAFAAGQREPIHGLLDEKRAACRSYEEAVRAMFGGDLVDRAIDEAFRRALRPAVERLGHATAENRRRLLATIAAHKRLLEVAATAIREMTPSASGYVRSGASSRNRMPPSAPPAMSFDQAL